MSLAEGTFKVNFRVPDVYGIYKFVIDYHRPGFSVIESTTVVWSCNMDIKAG